MLRERVSVDIQGHVWLAWGLCPAADDSRDGVGGCCWLSRSWNSCCSVGFRRDDSGVVLVCPSCNTVRACWSSAVLVCICWLCCIKPRSRIQEVTVWRCWHRRLNWHIAKPCSLHTSSAPFRWSKLLRIIVAAITHTSTTAPALPSNSKPWKLQRTVQPAASLPPQHNEANASYRGRSGEAAGD